MKNEPISVSELHAFINQTLQFAYPEVTILGEVASYKVNQGKWVFFDLKDEDSVVSCFIPIFQLKTKVEDGMLVKVVATPQLTKWGRFSLTVRSIELAGEGSVKRAFELLKTQFEKEGLFALDRKRALPDYPQKVALITSAQAAAFNDFVSIVNDRWAGLDIDHVQVQVQGERAPEQISEAVYNISQSPVKYDVLVLIRGGGSAEDLQSFNTEEVVRAVYGCSVPTLVGIGHEDDVSLAELAADVRAATPTDAARRLVPDKKEFLSNLLTSIHKNRLAILSDIDRAQVGLTRFEHVFAIRLQSITQNVAYLSEKMAEMTHQRLERLRSKLLELKRLAASLDPGAVLARGYSITRAHGQVITSPSQIQANEPIVIQLHQGQLKLNTAKRKPKNGKKPERQTNFEL